MRKYSCICAVVLSLYLAGCNAKRASVAVPAVPSVFDKSLYTTEEYKNDVAKYQTSFAAGTAADLEKAKLARNSIAYGLMSDVDEMYGRYSAGLFTGKGATAVVGDSIQLGLTAASTIAHPNNTKTIFSALATALTGVNLSYDKNFFAQQTFAALAIAMQVRRDKARQEIVEALDKDVKEYPLSATKRDIVSYFYAGTLPGGLQELQAEAGAAAAKQATDLAKPALH